VRFIFRRYAELGSVRLLKDELEAQSVRSKLRTTASGRKPFARGALYLMLQNRIYRGEIVHNQQSYLGEHKPIIDQPLWDAVQAQLARNAAERSSGARNHQPSLIAGMLVDGDGNRMTPSHAVKRGTRYRYYVSGSLITKERTDDSAGLRIPAAEIETARERPSAPMASRSRQHLQIDFGTARGRINSAAAPRAGRRVWQALARVARGTQASSLP
jgi:site-specific DNA recombinase